jgi:hypothetical protein
MRGGGLVRHHSRGCRRDPESGDLVRRPRRLREATRVTAFGMSLELPVLQSVDIASLVLITAAVLVIFRFNVGIILTLAGSALAGIIYYLYYLTTAPVAL